MVITSGMLGQIDVPPLRMLDWMLIVAFIVGTTAVAWWKRGGGDSLRAYFLGSRELPWLTVCLALMATEVSAAGYIGVPQLAYNGSLVYLQLAIGAVLARLIIGYYMVPAFYEREMYSPYDYMASRFGRGAAWVPSALFALGAVVGQAARLFILAGVFHYVAGVPMVYTAIGVVALAVLWSVLGGIRSIVWTSVLQFSLTVLGAVVTFIYLICQSGNGLSEVLAQARDAGKLQLLDLNLDYALEFTLWTGLFGSTFNTLASNGADQMNAQYLFCCRSPGEARKAIIASSLNQVFVFLLLLIGLALYTFMSRHQGQLAGPGTPVIGVGTYTLFIAQVLPVGIKGLLLVGLLAAGISGIKSALHALAQITVSRLGIETATTPSGAVAYARVFTALWGVGLILAAIGFQDTAGSSDVLNMALGLTSFTYGALIGSLLLAFSSRQRTARGVSFGAPFAVLTAFGMIWREQWAHVTLLLGVGLLLVLWFYAIFREIEELPRIREQDAYVRRAWYLLVGEFPRTLWALAAAALALSTQWSMLIGEEDPGGRFDLAWPWYLPMGVGITIVFGYLLGRPMEADVGTTADRR